MIPAASAVHVPAVATAVRNVECRSAEIEICAVWISCIYAESPYSVVPYQRTIEISSRAECAVLPVVEDVAQVEVTSCPVCAIQVVVRIYTHEIVEVYLVSSLILFVGEIQFVCHLVGQEQCSLPCLLVAHSHCRHCYCEHHSYCCLLYTSDAADE